MENLFLISMRKQTFLITFLASIWILLKNARTLKSFSYRTKTRIKSFNISQKDILSITTSLDPTKAHGGDNLSIEMVQIGSLVITITLKIIFERSYKKGKFLKIWKVANIVPIKNKEDKSLVKYYCPISLLPIIVKSFKRAIYSTLFKYFLHNKLFTPCQSGFLFKHCPTLSKIHKINLLLMIIQLPM